VDIFGSLLQPECKQGRDVASAYLPTDGWDLIGIQWTIERRLIENLYLKPHSDQLFGNVGAEFTLKHRIDLHLLADCHSGTHVGHED
jgi:hypothetical protein